MSDKFLSPSVPFGIARKRKKRRTSHSIRGQMATKIRGVNHRYKEKKVYFLKLRSETTMASETTGIVLPGRKGLIIVK